MVNVKKDDRKVEIRDDVVVFTYENEQHYSKEAARNIYVNLLNELDQKSKMIENFEKNSKKMEEELKSQIDQMSQQVTNQINDISEGQLNTWKKVQLRLQQNAAKQQMEKMKLDCKDLLEGLNIWGCCKELPKTEYEIKLERSKKEQQ